jgi:broad specificity phosphatase PhoE
MKIYFVRHGQSELNATDTHQLFTTPLSEKGKKQAKFVAERFQSIPIEKIFASDLTRAKQTAEAIANTTQKPLIFSELLRERRRPSEVIGKNYVDENAKKITDLIEQNLHDQNWHHSDEENFFDLKKRARNFLDLLEKEISENIAVVTHGAFLKMMILTVLFGNNFDSSAFQAFNLNAKMSNTGITVAEYIKNKWQLLTWNDYAHLGE